MADLESWTDVVERGALLGSTVVAKGKIPTFARYS